MHPILLEIGPLTLRTYGALVALAFLAALRMSKWAVKLRGIPEKYLMDLSIILVFTGLLGARLFYVLLNGSYYWSHPLDILKVWEGGLVFYGGFLTAAVSGLLYCRRHQLSVGLMADCLAPALAMGQAIGRWGCFFAGCCYGRPTLAPWGIRFKDPASLAPLDISLHPVQVYEAVGNLVIAFFLWSRLIKKPDAPHGQVFWLYVLLYGLLRFGVEMLRGDDRGPMWAGFYPSQVIALAAILVSGSLLIAQAASPEEKHGTAAENRKSG
jgi:phosphatidylglycerol---prolipoprotein diacylglyceryl transferase